MTQPQLNGTVYQYRSKHQWKETWLCLEADGKLTWKRKDAYQVKGVAYVDEIVQRISISSCSKNGVQNGLTEPFILHIPLRVQGTQSTKKLAVKSAQDLDSWLNAFATVIGKLKLWKACKRNQAVKISGDTAVDENNVANLLKYDDLIAFYSMTWKVFLTAVKRNGNLDDVDSADRENYTPSNGALDHQQKYNSGKRHKRNGSDGTKAIPNFSAVYENERKHVPSRMASRCSDAQLETIEEDIHF